MSLDLLSAFLIGLVGSGHCLGMCGGITTMLTSAITTKADSQVGNISVQVTQARQKPKLIICYHFGRIASYSLIGALVGFTGSIAAKNIGLPIAGLRLVAAVFLILLGLYIGQWFMLLTRIEAIGAKLWRKISPLANKVIPVDSGKKALTLGALWGWLPCGLVYSTLTWALASGNALTGAGIMLLFGLGTLPALLALSFSLASIKNLLVKPKTKQFMAILVIAYGFYSFFVAYQLMF
ncbi:sulfite exporter TauE/SafE family protein [Litorilituus sediminis]|uniref:Sulfite exporter TauE/SafE family protein n=1 Tax=Litorilituus sediminis TaxID=718192 RepID=A0A4P6P1Q2_9GAMM|nr:sulfite exporter TauE/SafE family protein [Litorilituus sediminis]QBG34468.1 sulfite exporter TauE/SafE family protein [Litorilituus sediminis]